MEETNSRKDFLCVVCKKSFSNKSHLVLHERVHTGEKPFSCNFCEKSFSDKSNLNEHKSSRNENLSFTSSANGMGGAN